MRSVPVTAAFLLACALSASAQTPAPVVNANGVTTAAGPSSVQGVAPGSLVSIFGSNLSSSMATSDTVPLSTTLGGVSVTFNSTPVPIQSVSSGQVSVQLPWGLGLTASQVVVTRDDGTASAPVSVAVVAGAPAIYNIGGQAIAINSDGSLAAPSNAFPGIATHPAVIGDAKGLTILATGLGMVDAPIADGANSLDLTRNTVAKPTVMIGGVPAQLVFSGLSPQYPGVNQINVVLPPGTPAGSAVTLQLQLDGGASSNTVTIAVSQ